MGPAAYLELKGEGDKSMPREPSIVSRRQERCDGGARVIWRRLDCLNPNLQWCNVFIHRKRRLKPVPHPVPVYLVGGCTFRDVGRFPVRGFKEMSGTPKSRCYVWQRRTRDRLRGASPMATECPW
jgi:hypothetical protein